VHVLVLVHVRDGAEQLEHDGLGGALVEDVPHVQQARQVVAHVLEHQEQVTLVRFPRVAHPIPLLLITAPTVLGVVLASR
jgi:hypothetical protein